MALSRRTGRSRFTLVLLVLTSITILTLDFRGSAAVEQVRDGVATVFSPVRGAADKVFGPVGDAWNGILHYGDVKQENDELRRALDDLKGQTAADQDATEQLAALAQLQNLNLPIDLQAVTARVVSGPIANFEHTIEIDKGEGAGIKVGMPVVTGAGLVGRVEQVTGSHSVIKVVTDPDFLIGVRLTTSQEVGVAHGSGDGEPLRIDSGISPGAQIPVDDVVTTSGADRSIFPPGVPIGTVISTELSADELSQIVTVEPLADLSRLSYLRVLLWEPPP
jgi:rod shape-determining protein MreC